MNSRDIPTSYVLRDGTKVKPFIIKMLEKRGIKSQEEIANYLEPQLKDLPPPDLMEDLGKASAIIGDSIISRSPILIWGDYDVDGTTATALLLQFLESVGHKQVEYYIPNRLLEGYGLQSAPLIRVDSEQCSDSDKLLITVDNGISAHKAVKKAKELGYKVIITDHHTPPEKRVAADAVLNPKQTICHFPGKNLAGVGVAFYLTIGIRTYLQKKRYFNKNRLSPNLKQLLGLVAIGTVADMVELDETNRILVRAGLETIASRENPGINALCNKTNLDCSLLRSEDISFQLAPKINAAGRLGFADKAVALLTCKSNFDAETLSAQLIKNNITRKAITLGDLSDAVHYVENSDTASGSSIIVLGDFHIGVAGIVASNLVDKYKKPAIVLCRQESGTYKGSARSVEGINLYDALDSCSALLDGFGGHAMAAGMSLSVEKVEAFREKFNDSVYAQSQTNVATFNEEEEEEVSLSELFSDKVLRQLLLLEPHGIGNPQPVFLDRNIGLRNLKRIGADKSHLRVDITSESSVINGIGFGIGELCKKCESEQPKGILYSPSLNYFRGKRNWQARVIEIQFDHD